MSIDSLPADPTVDPDIAPPSPPEQRRQVGELMADPPKPEEDILELTADERHDFATLLTVGRRVKKIKVMEDHSVTIQTLKTADEMRIGLYTKEYLESQGFSRAYQVAVCAAGIVDVNGAPLYQSMTEKPDEGDLFVKRAEKVSQYYPIVVTQIYQAIMDLEREFADVAIKLGKLGKPTG